KLDFALCVSWRFVEVNDDLVVRIVGIDGEINATDDLLVRADASERLAAQYVFAPLDFNPRDFGERRRCDQHETHGGEEPMTETKSPHVHGCIPPGTSFETGPLYRPAGLPEAGLFQTGHTLLSIWYHSVVTPGFPLT